MTPRRDEQRPAVEFLEVEQSEPIPVEALPPSHRSGRRWYLLLSAAVLLGAALIARTVTHDGSGAPTPPVSTAPPSPSRSVDAVHCSPGDPCTATSGIPAGVARAVLDVFPNAQLGDGDTLYLPSGALSSREFTATAGALSLRVLIQRPDGAMEPVNSAWFGSRTTFFRQLEHGFVVQLQLAGPGELEPSAARLYGFAADQRLSSD